MRILELDLIKYGPFTGRNLIFPEKIGMHVLLGPNEAGKSSALRALRALLYGVDERTLDNFLHENRELRVGGKIGLSDGKELAFVRRKGRKETVLTPEGTVMPDSQLAEFLGGVSLEQFLRMFGIGYQDLVDGGNEILQGKGEIGELLFSAGIGGKGLHEALRHFESRASELFRPQAKTTNINKSLREYGETKSRIKELSLTATKYLELSGSMERTKKDINKLNSSISELSAKKNMHERFLRVLPKVAERDNLLSRLENYTDVPDLPDGFSDERNDALARLSSAKENKGNAERSIEGIEKEMSEIRIPDGLLTHEFEIAQLNKELGGIVKAADDLPKLRTRYDESNRRALEILNEVRPGHPLERASELTKRPSEKAVINELSEAYHKLTADMARNGKDIRETNAELARTKKRLDSAPAFRDVTVLKKAVSKAQKHSGYEEELKQADVAIERLRAELAMEHESLPLWEGTAHELLNTPFPASETCDNHESRLSDAKTDVKAKEAELDKVGGEKSALERDLSQLKSGGTIPTEDELHKARERRDAGWQLVKKSWVDGEDVKGESRLFDNELPLPDAYEASVRTSDELSDGLRTEAERVARQAQLLANIGDRELECKKLGKELEAAKANLELVENDWRNAWRETKITPLSPKEMRAWLARVERIRKLAGNVLESEGRAKLLRESMDESAKALTNALKAVSSETGKHDKNYSQLLERCQDILDLVEKENSDRRQLENESAKLKDKIEGLGNESMDLSSSMDRWRDGWGKAVRDIGLDEDSIPASARAVLDRIDDLNKELGEARNLGDRINAMEKDAEEYASKVAVLVSGLAPDLANLPETNAVDQLAARLKKAGGDSVRLEGLKKQLQEKRGYLEAANNTISLMAEKLDSLCKQAGCDTPGELPEIEMKSAERSRLIAEQESLEKQILELGEGRSVDELTESAQTTDSDEVKAALANIDSQISSLEIDGAEKNQRIGELRKELERASGGADAAIEAEKAAATLARLRSGVELYVRNTMAGMILKREIEKYRQANQGL